MSAGVTSKLLTRSQIEFLELLLPFKEYNEAKDRYMQVKTLQRDAARKAKALQAKNAPIQAFKEYVFETTLSNTPNQL